MLIYNITSHVQYFMNKVILILLLVCMVTSQNPDQPAQPQQNQQTNNQAVQEPVVITQQELRKKNQEEEQKRKEQIERMKADPEMRAQLERQEREREQRRAKYKAQQERLRQLRKKQKQSQERRQQKMGGNENANYQADTQLTETQRVKKQQRQQFRKVRQNKKLKGDGDNINFRTIDFEIDRNIEEFVITPANDETFFLTSRVLVEKDNTYSQIQDVSQDSPLKLYVYEDNVRIVAQSSAYFILYALFQAKAKSTYILRFYNYGSPKLVRMVYSHHLSTGTIDKLYDGEDGKKHMMIAKNLLNSVQTSLDDLLQTQIIDHRNSKALVSLISQYFGYQLVEIVVVLVICFLQVHFIKKMFNSSSIV